jgi:hypothetical protein
LKCAVHVQVAEHLLPENCFRSTANFSHGLNTDETRIFAFDKPNERSKIRSWK